MIKATPLLVQNPKETNLALGFRSPNVEDAQKELRQNLFRAHLSQGTGYVKNVATKNGFISRRQTEFIRIHKEK